MKLIDLTADFVNTHVFLEKKPLKSARTAYTGMIYHYRHDSMATSYLDLPGHIAETDDGQNAQNCDPAAWYRQPARVLRLTPPHAGYGITPEDIERAMGKDTWTPWIFINALGSALDGREPLRQIWLTMDSVQYLIDKKVKVLFSDAWESPALDGVFLKFFGAGVSAVCNMKNLDKLPEHEEFLATVAFLPYPGNVTQMTARILAEVK